MFYSGILVLAIIPLIGASQIPLQPNFALTEYLGLWYELYHIPMPFELNGTDTTAFYVANPDGTVGITNKEWLPAKNQWNVAKAYGSVISNAQFEIHFTEPFIPFPGDYRVLYTDYNEIALVYAESKIGPTATQLAWILARKPNVESATIERAFQIFKERTGLSRFVFQKTEHGIAPSSQVRAVRSETEEIPLQPDFSLTQYLGLWYELYHIPMPFELNGTDTTAFYVANPDGTVGITNKEWLPAKKQWNVAKAYGSVISNAQLEIHFTEPFIPFPGDYRVLYTDYNEIALVYAESKAGPSKVQLAWILARRPNVNSDTTEKAFQIFKEKTGLSRFVFQKTEHGTAPASQFNAVLVKGSDIPLQPNFSLSDYTGKWYEIYRTTNMPFESGTDITAVYGANADGTVAVTNREWLPEKKQWSEKKATADVVGNAQLSVHFSPPPVPGGDYRVLYTDYKTVSVVYSGTKVLFWNVEYAWILSRTQQLDQATVDMAFQIFKERTGLDKSKFMMTQHGVAPIN